MAGIVPAGPVSGVQGLVFVDPNPEASAEVFMGNPWLSPGGPGYQATPLRYPGQMYSLGYGEYPTIPDPDTELVHTGTPIPSAGVAGPGTPYFDATPNTHAGPWPHPVGDSHTPDGAAYTVVQSWDLHGDGLDNRQPGRNIAATQDRWEEVFNSPAGGALVGDGGQNRRVSAGWGSTDASQNPAGVNDTADRGIQGHRRLASGRNLPLNFLWMRGAGRPLVSSVRGLQALPVGNVSPYAGQDPSYGYGTAGAVLTMPAGEYEAPAAPWQPGPLSQQGLLEGPL